MQSPHNKVSASSGVCSSTKRSLETSKTHWHVEWKPQRLQDPPLQDEQWGHKNPSPTVQYVIWIWTKSDHWKVGSANLFLLMFFPEQCPPEYRRPPRATGCSSDVTDRSPRLSQGGSVFAQTFEKCEGTLLKVALLLFFHTSLRLSVFGINGIIQTPPERPNQPPPVGPPNEWLCLWSRAVSSWLDPLREGRGGGGGGGRT